MKKIDANYAIKTTNAYFRIGSIFSSPSIVLLLLVAMCIDFCFQFPATEALYTQALWLSVFTALAFAFAIDSLPLVMASSFLQLCDSNNNRTKHITLFSASFMVFLLLFGLSFELKFSLMEQLFAGAATLTTSTLITATTYEASAAEISMVMIQNSVQLATSLFLFAVSISKSLTEQRKKFQCNLSLNITARNLIVNAQIEELSNAARVDRDAIEDKKFAAACALVDSQAALQKHQARTALAMRLQDTSASSYLLES